MKIFISILFVIALGFSYYADTNIIAAETGERPITLASLEISAEPIQQLETPAGLSTHTVFVLGMVLALAVTILFIYLFTYIQHNRAASKS